MLPELLEMHSGAYSAEQIETLLIFPLSEKQLYLFKRNEKMTYV
jgi:hypothetical protein